MRKAVIPDTITTLTVCVNDFHKQSAEIYLKW